jgi:hypothetical protein
LQVLNLKKSFRNIFGEFFKKIHEKYVLMFLKDIKQINFFEFCFLRCKLVEIKRTIDRFFKEDMV